MKFFSARVAIFIVLSVAVSPAVAWAAAAAPTRTPNEDVNSAAVRTRASLQPGQNLLHSGWGVTPVGRQIPISDMAIKMIVSPDRRVLVAVSAGFNHTGITLLDLKTKEVVQFHPLRSCFNGLAFSADGQRLFVAGGDKGEIHVFTYRDGKATPAGVVHPDAAGAPVFIAGIAVHPRTGKLYVCNEANHEVWVLNAETLLREATIATGAHPHSCMFGGDGKHLYVSNWGARSVSVVNTDTNERVRDVTVGIRPNDMALARDGRLFVACAGDNTVHVITTNQLEKLGEPASPARRLWEGTRE